jgi:hypothetical protein
MTPSGGEDEVLLECDAMWNGEKLPTLRRSELTAPSGSQNVKSLMVRDKQTFILWVG